MFLHCSSSFPSSRAPSSVIYHGDWWKTNQNTWVNWSNLVNNSEKRVCVQQSRRHRKTQQSHFKHHKTWVTVALWNYMSEENTHNSITHPFLLQANKDVTWLFAGRRRRVFLMWRSKLSSSIINIKQAAILKRCLMCRIKWHKKEKERLNTSLCTSAIFLTHWLQ